MDDPLTRAEALVGIAMCAAYADGSMDAEEDEEFTEILQSWNALSGLDEAALREAMMRVDAISRKHGEHELLARAAAALPEDLRATAFYMGADLLVSDGELAPEEHAFVLRLQKALGVGNADAAKILHVVGIFNKA